MYSIVHEHQAVAIEANIDLHTIVVLYKPSVLSAQYSVLSAQRSALRLTGRGMRSCTSEHITQREKENTKYAGVLYNIAQARRTVRSIRGKVDQDKRQK